MKSKWQAVIINNPERKRNPFQVRMHSKFIIMRYVISINALIFAHFILSISGYTISLLHSHILT